MCLEVMSPLTEDKLRTACGLPVRDRSKDTGNAGAVLLHIPEPEEDKEIEESKWSHLRDILVSDMLDRCVSSITLFEFQHMKLESSEVPNQSRTDLWKGLSDRKFMIKGCSRHSRGRASVQMQPVLAPRTNFSDAVKIGKVDEAQIFTETVSLNRCTGRGQQELRPPEHGGRCSLFSSQRCRPASPREAAQATGAEAEMVQFEKLACKVRDHLKVCKALTELGLHEAKVPVPAAQKSHRKEGAKH